MNSTNKKNIIIYSATLGSLLLILVGVIIAFFIIKPFDKEEVQMSDELKKYSEMFKLELENNEYYIRDLKTKYRNNTPILTIPDAIDNIPVTKLIDDTNSFSNYKSVSEIIIGKNIKYIGTKNKDLNSYYEPFSGATGLSTITVHEDNPFFESVEGVLYSEDLKTLIKYPASKSFAMGYNSYTLLDSTITISRKAFYESRQLEEVVLNNGLENIENSAFYNCINLESITLVDSIKMIGSNAFNGCESINEITLPKNLEEIGTSPFNGCFNLNKINISNKLNIELDNTKIFSGIQPQQTSWEISVKIDTNNNPNLLDKFNSYDFIKSIGLTGTSIPNQRFIIVNGLFGFEFQYNADSYKMVYLENRPNPSYVHTENDN